MIAAALGIIGILANVMVYQQKTTESLLHWKWISDVIWGIHYFSLGAYTGFAAAMIALFRESVSLCRKHKWAQSRLWYVFFILLGICSAVITWNGIFGILPAVGSVISIISFLHGNPRVTRVLAFPVSGMMLTYDVIFHSYPGIVNEVFTLISATFAIITLHVKTKTSKTETSSYLV